MTFKAILVFATFSNFTALVSFVKMAAQRIELELRLLSVYPTICYNENIRALSSYAQPEL